MTPDLIYALGGAALVAIGLYRAVVTEDLLRRVLAINVFATGIASMLLATGAAAGDPVPQAFVLTGIVVLVSTTAVALALIRRLHEDHRDD